MSLEERLISDESEIRISNEDIIRIILAELGWGHRAGLAVLRDRRNEPIALLMENDPSNTFAREVVRIRPIHAPRADAVTIDGRHFERMPSSGLDALQAMTIAESQLASGFDANDVQFDVGDGGTIDDLTVTVALPLAEADGLLVPFDVGLRFTQWALVPPEGDPVLVTQVRGHAKGVMRWGQVSGFTDLMFSGTSIPVAPILQAFSGR
jgi:hypothetical protein